MIPERVNLALPKTSHWGHGCCCPLDLVLSTRQLNPAGAAESTSLGQHFERSWLRCRPRWGKTGATIESTGGWAIPGHLGPKMGDSFPCWLLFTIKHGFGPPCWAPSKSGCFDNSPWARALFALSPINPLGPCSLPSRPQLPCHMQSTAATVVHLSWWNLGA